tara:strand:- start:856 stop:1080 length:225 start_codon:yes stop_codon:yes gene_type:complete
MAKKKIVKEVLAEVETVIESVEVIAEVIEEVKFIDTKVEELLDIQNQLNSKPNSDQRSIFYWLDKLHYKKSNYK